MSAGAQITWDDEVKKAPQNRPVKTPQIQWDSAPEQDADYLGPNAEPYVQPRAGESFQDTMQRAVRMGRTVTPEQQRAELKSDVQLLPRRLSAGTMAATAPFGLAELVEAPAATLLGLGGGTLLGGGARYATEALGGGPVAQDIATLGGSALGGYLGAGLANPELGNLAASKLRYPATARQSQLGRPGTIKPFLPSFMQRWTVPDWAIPKGELGTPTNPGWFGEIPTKMPRVGLGTSLGASERGNLPGVAVVPEPREPLPGDRPGSQWSIKRKTELLPAAMRGQPGAGDVLSNLRPVIYSPKGAGLPGPREVVPLEGLQVLGMPKVDVRGLPPTEQRVTLGVSPTGTERRIGGFNLLREQAMAYWQQLADDPTAPMRDREIARLNVQHYRENPGESGGEELARDIRNIRADMAKRKGGTTR